MKLSFIGADHEVTGSCHCLSFGDKTVLIDCGMEQGPNEYENAELPVAPADVDFVLLTHAHIDHSGLIPLIFSHGFRGAIYSTVATHDLCEIMLRDSAHIQMFEAEWRNRKGKRAGAEPFAPLYDMAAAEGALKLFVPCEYQEKITVCEGLEIRFTDIGHLLGSSSIEAWVTEGTVTKKIVFSGDIGNLNQPLIKDPSYTEEADYVLTESTYGNRVHEAPPDYASALAEIIQKTLDRGGNLVIPSFAVGRTQEILYFIRKIKADKLVHGHDNFPVYVDSPLAVEATTVFNRNVYDCFDEDAMKLVQAGINPISFPNLQFSITSDDSKMINFNTEPKVILSASGMCEAGRIRHHLKHNLWRADSTVLFVGYQAEGTLGRILLQGEKKVKIFGETIEVKADIIELPGISGHADKNGLLRWIKAFKTPPQKVFVVHGDDAECEDYTACLKNELGIDAEAPYSGAVYDLLSDSWVTVGVPKRIEKPAAQVSHASPVFERLLAAGQRLLSVIRRNEGGANKDLGKFADQINDLCNKWER